MSQYSYKTSETIEQVVYEAYTANKTVARIPPGTRHIRVSVFHRTVGRVVINGDQWDQAEANTEHEFQVWIKSADTILIAVTGTGTISIAWS